MGVVLRKAPDPQKPVENAGALVPVNRPQLGVPYGKVAVAPQMALVDLYMERAVHRLYDVVLPLYIHR